MVNKGGRPAKFKTPEEMQIAIDAYFTKCDPHVEEFDYLEWDKDHTYQEVKTIKRVSEQAPYTMSGLAMELGFEDRRSLIDYEGRDRFSRTIKSARKRVEIFVESLMLKSNGSQVAGVIFNAKNNFAWKDQSQTDITTAGKELPAPILGGVAKRVPADNSTPKAG